MSFEILNVTKTFGKKTVLNNLSLTINENNICAIVGTNGVGKSTLIKSILGLIKRDTGTITFNGEDIALLINRGKVGYLPEALGFSKNVTLRNYLKDMAVIKGIDKSHIDERIDYLLELFHLKDRENDNVSTFSKGMKKMVGFMQSVLSTPELLILDEPTDGLDPISRRTMLNYIKKISQEGCTVIITSHILADLELITDKVVVLNRGRIINEINREKFQQKQIQITITYKDGREDLVKADYTDENILLECCDSDILKNMEIRLKSSSLEDLFLDSLRSGSEVEHE